MVSSLLEKNAIYIILVFAFILRFTGLNFGLPDLYGADENFIMDPVKQMLTTGDMNPHWFVFPGSFLMYLLAVLFSVLSGICFVYYFLTGKVHNLSEFNHLVESHVALNTVLPYYSGRLMMALFAVISVFLVYLIGRKIFNHTVGILAAFCLSIAPLYVNASRLIRPDITESMLILFSFYFLLLFFEENKKIKYLIASSLSAGFAIATKYPAGVIVFPILFYCFMKDFSASRPSTFFKALLCIAAGFLVFAPFFLLDYRAAVKDILWEATRNDRNWPERFPGILNDIWYFKASLINGIGTRFFTIFAALGLLILLIKRTFQGTYFLFFPLVYYIVMVDLGRLRFDRWLIPVLPFEAILFGLGFFTFYKYFWQKGFILKNVVRLLLILFVCASVLVLKKDINEGIKLSRPDSRTIAKDWVEQNIPSGSKIAFELKTPPLRQDHKNNFVLMDLGWGWIVDKPLSYYESQGVRYIIINGDIKYMIYNNPHGNNLKINRYKELKKKAQLMKTFKYEANPGPVIEVYRLK